MSLGISSQSPTGPLRLPSAPAQATPESPVENTSAAPASEPQDSGQVQARERSANDPKSLSFPEKGQSEVPARNFYVNGIMTPEDKAQRTVRELERVTGEPIELLYNETEGLLQDGIEALKNMAGVKTDEAERTAQAVSEALKGGEPVRLIAHSQGAAIVGDALERVAESLKQEGKSEAEIKDMMSKVEVIAMGGFATENAFPEGVKVNLINREKDFIPKFAERFRDLDAARKSEDKDMGRALWDATKTFGSFIGTNVSQAVQHTFGKVSQAAENDFYGMSFAEGVAHCMGSVCVAVESDHLVVIDDEYTREKVGQGYLADFEAQYQAQA